MCFCVFDINVNTLLFLMQFILNLIIYYIYNLIIYTYICM